MLWHDPSPYPKSTHTNHKPPNYTPSTSDDLQLISSYHVPSFHYLTCLTYLPSHSLTCLPYLTSPCISSPAQIIMNAINSQCNFSFLFSFHAEHALLYRIAWSEALSSQEYIIIMWNSTTGSYMYLQEVKNMAKRWHNYVIHNNSAGTRLHPIYVHLYHYRQLNLRAFPISMFNKQDS